jgi:hydrogenase maturation factor
VEGADVVGALRLLARPGDVLLVVSAADDPVADGLLRRAEAWGLTRLWLGAGTRPLFGRAEQVVWLEGVDPAMAARSGDLVMLYHLLWELTHVVFEHPGLLAAEAPGPESRNSASGYSASGYSASGYSASGYSASECSDEVCITCSDEGRVAEVTSVGAWGQAEVVVAGRSETVDVSLVDPVDPGDLVLVHAGVALTTLEAGGLPRSRS